MHSVDNAISFSDGSHTWVLDPNLQVQARNVSERFPFEFNGDGFPLVASRPPMPMARARRHRSPFSRRELLRQSRSTTRRQCVTVTTILSDPDADPHEFQPTAGDVRPSNPLR